MEDRARQEESFELIKGLLASRGPVPAVVLLCEVKEGASDSGVVGDEPMIEVGKAKEQLHIFDLGRG